MAENTIDKTMLSPAFYDEKGELDILEVSEGHRLSLIASHILSRIAEMEGVDDAVVFVNGNRVVFENLARWNNFDPLFSQLDTFGTKEKQIGEDLDDLTAYIIDQGGGDAFAGEELSDLRNDVKRIYEDFAFLLREVSGTINTHQHANYKCAYPSDDDMDKDISEMTVDSEEFFPPKFEDYESSVIDKIRAQHFENAVSSVAQCLLMNEIQGGIEAVREDCRIRVLAFARDWVLGTAVQYGHPVDSLDSLERRIFGDEYDLSIFDVFSLSSDELRRMIEDNDPKNELIDLILFLRRSIIMSTPHMTVNYRGEYAQRVLLDGHTVNPYLPRMMRNPETEVLSLVPDDEEGFDA